MSLLANSNAIESGGYNIDRSLRFRSSASAYLSRTFGTPTNQAIWTWSGWVKRGVLGTATTLLATGTGASDTTRFEVDWSANNTFRLSGGTTIFRESNRVFRDPSAFGHLVIVIDTTQGTASNRARAWWNNEEITWATNNTLTTCGYNTAAASRIGKTVTDVLPFDGYLAEVNFIDGQALTPPSFGQTDPVTGVWTPKKYTGTYGTNGFYLPFSDNTSATTLCYDMSGSSTTVSSAAYFTPTGGVSQSGIVFQSGTTIANFYNGITTDLITYNIPVNGYLMLDAGSGNTLNLTKWGFYIRNASSNETWSIQYSSDGTSWSNATTGWSPSSAGWNDVTFSSVGAYRYWRAIVTTQVNGEYYTEYRVYGTGTYRNANDWTPNNISLTAGATYDSMTDVPTLTSATAANFPTLNPLEKTQVAATSTITWGNLRAFAGTSGGTTFPATIGVSSGKWYFEVNAETVGAFGTHIGISRSDAFSSDAAEVKYQQNGNKLVDNTSTSYGATWTGGDVIGCAVDMDGSSITFYKNGVSQGAISYTFSSAYLWFPVLYTNGNSQVLHANFGQRPFSYTPPSGFKALNTYNLPDPTIKKPNQYMDATLYSGTSASQSVTNAGAFQPDLVWVKSRSAATDHKLTDSVRGTTKALISDTTGAETTDTNGLTAFNSNGFTVGSDSVYNNGTGPATYVGWQWKAGGTSSSNTSGSITSTVSVNTTAGFSVVTWVANNTAGATVGHGLGVAPSLVIVKNRSAAGFNWSVYHASLGGTKWLWLNSTAAATTSAREWNNTAPTSSVFTVGDSTSDTNSGTGNRVGYCWAEIAGFSKFGSYTGNGSADGPFCYTGFQPKYVLMKGSSVASHWIVYDTARNTYNVVNNELSPNNSSAENGVISSGDNFDIVSNGFKIRGVVTNDMNVSGQTYIYAAFAESPFKYALGR